MGGTKEMKIVKRDGHIVDYDPEKIRIAIGKANEEVRGREKATKEEIKEIIEYIEDLNKKRILVEDIQDIIEQKLMELDKYKLAKKYITYRYTRELVRKANTTDQTIKELIEGENEYWNNENSNKNAEVVTTQRDYLAGITSTDITRRFLLPEDIVKAHDSGIIHFHDADYFAQNALHNCELINLDDMLQNGTVINGVMIEKPHRFITAATIATQIILAVTSSSYGGATVSLTHLAPFVRLSYEKYLKKYQDRGLDKETCEKYAMQDTKKEVEDGVQTFNYQVNSMTNTNGQAPFLSVNMYLGETDEYKDELAMIIEEFLKQRILGFKNEKGVYITPAFPKLLYVLEEDNIHEDSKYWYLTELAAKCTAKRMVPDYISEKMMKKLKPIFVVVLALLTGLCLFACIGCKNNDDSGSGDKPGGDPSTPQNAITLNYYSKDMIYGDSLSLIATYEKQPGVTLVWSSTNEQVATVNEEGDVSTVSVGEADIIATYGENKATCHISVSFGEYLPQLIIENVSDGNIVLSKGSEYKIKGYVYFNGAKYYDGVEIANNGNQQSVVSISEDHTVTANDVGEAEIVFYTQWKGFGGSTLQKTITVKVVEDVEMNTYVQVGDNNEITDSIELSLVDEWQGKNYDSFAALSVDFMVGGEKVQKEYEFIKEDGTNVISVEGNKVYAENIGSTFLTVKCEDGGKEYTNVINVTVVCPTESYEDRLDYCVSDDFAVNEIFGDGAVILSAYQGNRELTVKRGKFLEGVVVNGAETEKLTLLSSLGGFVFENVNAYTDMIATAEEFVNVFKLANGKIIDGYYYLANDITVDMTAQTGSYYELNGKQNRYFQGIFDGQGYTTPRLKRRAVLRGTTARCSRKGNGT